jgi:hypothetical protein
MIMEIFEVITTVLTIMGAVGTIVGFALKGKVKKKLKQAVEVSEDFVELIEYSSTALEDDKIDKKEWEKLKSKFKALKASFGKLF